MRIAINTRFLLPGQLEGFGWYTHEITRRMVLAHPEDEFIFLFDRKFDPSYVYASNVKPVVLAPEARHPILFRIWFEWVLPRVLRREKADVFFSPDSMCSLSAKTPTVMTCHDLVPWHFPEQVERRHRHYLLKYLPKWINRAEGVLTVSEFVRQDIIQSFGASPDRIHAVYNGCREVFQPLSLEDQHLVRKQYAAGQDYFFYAGAIHPRKNVHRLIQAFDLFKQKSKSPVKLLLAGRFAWKTGEVRTAWEQAQSQQDIQFLGYVGEDELPRLTAAATAMVYVSLSEGFGLPLVEAMACDVPVLTSNVSCLPEVAGDAALLVDPFSIEDIANALERLSTDSDLVQKLIENGRIQRQKYSWDVAAAQIYDILKACAATR